MYGCVQMSRSGRGLNPKRVEMLHLYFRVWIFCPFRSEIRMDLESCSDFLPTNEEGLIKEMYLKNIYLLYKSRNTTENETQAQENKQ